MTQKAKSVFIKFQGQQCKNCVWPMWDLYTSLIMGVRLPEISEENLREPFREAKNQSEYKDKCKL